MPGRKIDLRQLPGTDVVPPQTAQVLGEDQVHPPCLYVLQQPLKPRPPETGAGKTVVYVLSCHCPAVVSSIGAEQGPLPADADTLPRPGIVPGQPQVEGRPETHWPARYRRHAASVNAARRLFFPVLRTVSRYRSTPLFPISVTSFQHSMLAGLSPLPRLTCSLLIAYNESNQIHHRGGT